MGDGLQKSADDRLREWLNRFTTNPIMGVLVGIFVTICIQSSSATTVITVGLVSAGFLTLRQAIGVIMGANIGTTITAFIIGIDIGIYFYPLLAIGAGFFIFSSKGQHTNILVKFCLALVAYFLGLELMSASMQSLHQLADFASLTLHLSNQPILGIFFRYRFYLACTKLYGHSRCASRLIC
ncbi:Na/Pi symporter [Lysinibacillus sp. MHQ-1]|nr:Na/Pi symporter [Lysinibacillus sp. MHQ-1]